MPVCPRCRIPEGSKFGHCHKGKKWFQCSQGGGKVKSGRRLLSGRGLSEDVYEYIDYADIDTEIYGYLDDDYGENDGVTP